MRTLNLLQCPDFTPAATFISARQEGLRESCWPVSLIADDRRLELPVSHRYFTGIDASMSIDQSTHSLFGVSETAADLLVQEFGRYFEMPTVCFRGGCLTGPNHAGTRLHGFLPA